jgi:splicing factor 3B subunit 3
MACFGIVGLNVGFENPLFASLEVDYSDSDADPSGDAYRNIEKKLIFYELDLGLNHVVRKWSEVVDPTANHLIAVPGGAEGPSGVVVCSEGKLTWYHEEYESVSIQIPVRKNPLFPDAASSNDSLVVCSIVHKLKSNFFILIQTENGDVFKVTMDYETRGDGVIDCVSNIRLKYFETLPVAKSICLLKAGFLFLASEVGNQYY